MKKKKGKLAYKIIWVYLLNHFFVVACILGITENGIRKIESTFLEKYHANALQAMEALDEEFLQIKFILSYMMQSKNVLMLRERKEYLTLYEEVDNKIRVREELTSLVSQYRFIEDIGIYLPEHSLWISVQDGYLEETATVCLPGERIVYRDGSLYLTIGTTQKDQYTEGYVKFSESEMLNFMTKLRVDENMGMKLSLYDKILYEVENLADEKYKEITVTSQLYPLILHMYISDEVLNFQEYLYLLGGVLFAVLSITTFFFVRYSNRAIHLPLQNMVEHISSLNERNFKTKLKHQGMDEFKYVTIEFNQMKEHLEVYIEKSYEQEIAMKQMELDHLQEQIKPHFLYNCFFNIANLCKTYDVEKVEQLSNALARYYRYITRTGKSMVTLQEEYEHMRNYLQVQKIRFEDRVEIVVDELPESASSIKVPRLILQPIVENAYKYVFEHIEREGLLRVSAWEDSDFVTIEVEDSGYKTTECDIKKARESIHKVGNSITGLGNLQQRLRFLNSNNGMVVTRSELGGLSNRLVIDKRGN